MCGIAGIVSVQPEEVTVERLQQMTDSIAHRGPDGAGHWISDNGRLGLGHRRLSIIDLSTEANQPMFYLDRYAIVFNGEIYNYIELKDVLVKQGYRFQTASDTEVLLALYHRDKERCLKELDGMFAFAIYDKVEQTLFCARDRFGEKPFHYYVERGKRFVFGSEMKELWAVGVPKEANNSMLYQYIQSGYMFNPQNPAETFYTHIQRLNPAHYLVLNVQTLKYTISKYWDIELNRQTQLSIEEASVRFKELFLRSVSRRLRSDVPVGSSLSGGLDSSAVVCAIDELNTNKSIHQKTFSAQFPGYEKDESVYQQMVINQTKADAYFTQPTADTLLNELDKVFWHQEEPFGSSSLLAQYEVFKLAKQQQVTVLLDGQGADEVLAGYHSYLQSFFLELQRNKTVYRQQWNEYMKLHANNPINILFKKDLKYRIRTSMPFATQWLKKGRNLLVNRRGYFSEAFYADVKGRDFVFNNEMLSLNQTLKEGATNGPLQELLRYADRNSMAHSREVRLPFLNHELVEFLFTLPATYKMNNGWTKYIMRKSFDDMMPKEITWRVDKVGYEPPQKQWMQKPEVKEFIQESRRVLVHQNILDKTILDKPINPADAHGHEGDNSWRIWMSAYMYK